MPKIAAEMTALQVGRLRGPGDYRVGGVQGLMLRIQGNSRVWVLKVRIGDKRPNIGLGPYPAVSLAQAREKARAKREQLASGESIVITKAQARKVALAEAASSVLFREAALAMIQAKRVEWSNPKHAQQWTNTLETYAFPVIGSVPVSEIDVAMILQVLEPIWYEKPETASRVRGRIEAAIDYACVKHQLKMDNPARWKGHLDVLLPAKAKVRKVVHHKAVPWRTAREAAMAILRSPGVASRCLMFTLLTGCRSGEALRMNISEVDFDRGVWTIPEERMKARREHSVPLSQQALMILAGVTPNAEGLVFVSSQSKTGEFSDAAMCAVMDRLGIDATTHGWRSTFRDWGSETTEYPNEMLEMALAHTIENKAEAAYRRGDMLERRRPLMQGWADYVMPLPTAS